MTNKKSLVNRCEPIPGTGDQETALFLDAHILARRQKCETKKKLWKRGDFDKVRMDISELVADFVRTNTVNASVDQLWLTLKDKIQSTMEQYVPSKMTSSRFS